jgi:hypothetical protein
MYAHLMLKPMVFHDDDVQYKFKSQKGINEEVVRQISAMKNEPQWMTDCASKLITSS